MRRLFGFLILAVTLMALPLSVFAASSTDEAVLGNNRWSVQNDGDLVPNANTYSIGSATQYPASIWINGSEYSSFAAGSDGNWTDDGLLLTANGAPTKFILTYSSGDMAATGFTVGTGDVTFAQGGKLDGDTNGTLKLIEASDTLSFIFSGTTIQLDSSDGGFQFGMTSAAEGYVDFLTNNDTDDYLRISTVTNVPTIVTAGTSNLEIAPDGGTTTITGAATVTGLVTSAGLTTSSTITLQNSETIVNSTNGTVTVGGADSPILNVLAAGTTNEDAILSLTADAAGDSGDVWRLNSDGATNSLLFENNTSGSQATILTLASTGLLTTTADVTVAGTTPLVTIGDGGDEDAGIQINSDTNDFYIASENGADDLVIGLGSSIGTTPIISMTDTGVTTVTGSTDGELNIWAAGATASDAYLRLIGDIQTDASDSWQIWNDSSAGALIIGNDDTTPGTYVDKMAIDSTGDFYVYGSEATAGSINIWADNGDEAADKFSISMDAADLLTMTTGATEAATISTAGLWTLPAVTVTGATLTNGAVTLGNAIGDIITVTGKVAGASPISFDGTTADTVYTILAVDDPASSSKTVTLPAVTGTVKLTGAAVALTPGAAVALTVAKGTTLYTDTVTDNENQEITFSGAGAAGDEVTIIFTSAGTADEVITFHATLVSSAGGLTLGTTASHYMTMRFVSNGSHWFELSRTADQT